MVCPTAALPEHISNFHNGKVRPTGKLVWTGDGSGWFTINSWSSWTASNGWGFATAHVRSCWGTCFKYATEHTTLHFYQVSSHNGQHYFTRLHFSLAHNVGGLGSSTLKSTRAAVQPGTTELIVDH